MAELEINMFENAGPEAAHRNGTRHASRREGDREGAERPRRDDQLGIYHSESAEEVP